MEYIRCNSNKLSIIIYNKQKLNLNCNNYNIFLRFLLYIIIINLSCSYLNGQNYDPDFYFESDPAKGIEDPTERFEIHESFLKKAKQSKDTLSIILGNLYLSNDFIVKTKYTDAIKHLIEAKEFASATNDTFFLGRINHKKGSVQYLLKNIDESIDYYRIALVQSEIAKDSHYIAITLEQLGSNYSIQGKYEMSNKYYELAIPIIKEQDEKKSMIVTLINYGISLSQQDRTVEAIQKFKLAIEIGEEIEDDYELYAAKINLANVYSKIGQLEPALNLYNEAMKVYEKNSWLYYLTEVYFGITIVYEQLGNIDSAYHYFQKYHYLQDSVLGSDVQNRISELEEEAKINRNDIEILSLKEKTLKDQKKLKNIIIGGLVLLLIIVWILWYFYHKNKKSKISLEESRKALKSLTDLLATKNSEISKLKNQQELKLYESSESEKTNNSDLSDLNLYDISVLTEEDWQTFKNLFEKSYPNYLRKIRISFPNISEAEERLFIFIKLRISTKEAANILGIQPDTVKKTRTRLKKRLELSKSEDLNEYIHSF